MGTEVSNGIINRRPFPGACPGREVNVGLPSPEHNLAYDSSNRGAELAVGLSISYKLDEDLRLSSRTTLVFNLQKLGNYLAPELTSLWYEEVSSDIAPGGKTSVFISPDTSQVPQLVS